MSEKALDGTRSSIYFLDPDEIVIIGLDTKDGKEHALYDERIHLPLEESMVLNIMEFGIIEPVSVRQNAGIPEVVDGRRRVMHSREANKRLKKQGKEPVKVPVHIKREAEGRLVGMMISANEIRKDDSPMRRAEKVARYLSLGHDEQDAAIAFGVGIPAIEHYMKLIDLSPHVQKLVENETISASAAAKLHGMTHAEQKEAIEEIAKNGEKVTAKKTEKKAKEKKGDDTTIERPGARIVKRVLDNNDIAKEVDGETVLSEEFVRGVRWVIGDLPDTHVKGLRALMEPSTKKAEAAK